MLAANPVKILLSLAMLLAMSVGASASPTDNADSTAEYNAYVYTYISRIEADGVASIMADDGIDGETATMVSDFVNDAFKHCYIALLKDDDSQWQGAVDDLKLARLWCETLVVFAQDSYPSSVISEIESLMWNLDIAIANAEAAVPSKRDPIRLPRVERRPWGR